MKQATLLWLVIGSSIGAMTWFGIQFFGVGRLQSDAVQLAVLSGVFTFGLNWVRIPAPKSRKARRNAVLTSKMKLGLAVLFSVATAAAGALAAVQAVRGYPNLAPAELSEDADRVSAHFYTVTGQPMMDAVYEMSGSDGEYVLLPLKEYGGRLLVMLPTKPRDGVTIRVTGRLRDKIRTVQRAKDGQIEGPFLRLYREHVNLVPNTRVYFLDTGQRAGLNVQAVAFILVPLYFLLLILSAPTRRPRMPSATGLKAP